MDYSAEHSDATVKYAEIQGSSILRYCHFVYRIVVITRLA